MLKDDSKNIWVHICGNHEQMAPAFKLLRAPSSICSRCRMAVDLFLQEEEVEALEKMIANSADRFLVFYKEHLTVTD